MDETQDSENQEVTPQSEDSSVVEQDSPVESAENPQAQEETKQERNWRELRKKEQDAQLVAREASEKVRVQQELIQNLLLSQQAQTQQAQTPTEVDEFESIPDDEYLSKAQSRKMHQKDARAIAREEFQRLEKERDNKNFMSRLKDLYPDFDDVVNSETIAKFDKEKPKLAKTIASLKDPYDIGLQTYEFMKAMNSSDPSKERHAREVEKNIEKNEKSIQSPQAYNKRPMAQAFSTANMSKDEKSKLYEEMMGHAGKSGFSY